MRNMVDISAQKPSRANQPSQHTLDLITTLDPKPTQLSRQMTLKIPARGWAIWFFRLMVDNIVIISREPCAFNIMIRSGANIAALFG